MPFANEHAARVRDPGQFQPGSFRRLERKADGKTVILIVGRIKGEPSTTTQAFRFPKDDWTAPQARTWARAHGAKLFEAAAKTKAASRGEPSKQKPKSLDAWVADADSLLAFSPAGAIGGTEDHPIRRYVKDILHTGSWTHPTKGWTLDIDDAYLDRLAENFGRMQAEGYDCPATIDHSQKAEDAIGQVVEVWRDGGILYGTHELVGQRALDLTTQPAVHVSAEIDERYQTSKGDQLGPALVASTLCQRPVVPGQQGFVEIAASRSTGRTGSKGDTICQASVLRLAHWSPADADKHGDLDMDELLTFAREMAGIKDLDDKAKPPDILKALSAAWQTQADKLTATTAKEKAATTEVGKLREQLKAAKLPELPREVAALSRRALKTDLGSLVQAAKITPKTAELLSAALDTPLMLSIADGAEDPGYAQLIEALKENDAGVLGKQLTKGQAVTLDRSDDSTPPPSVDPDVQQSMTAAAYGVAKKAS